MTPRCFPAVFSDKITALPNLWRGPGREVVGLDFYQLAVSRGPRKGRPGRGLPLISFAVQHDQPPVAGMVVSSLHPTLVI